MDFIVVLAVVASVKYEYFLQKSYVHRETRYRVFLFEALVDRSPLT